MRRSFFAGLMPLLLAALPAAAAQPPPAALLTPVDALIAGLNAGSAQRVAAAYAPGATIVDEFAPFEWGGAGAPARWFADFGTTARSAGMSAVHVSRHAPKFVESGAVRAWMVIPTDYTYRMKGRAEKETGAWTFVLASAAGRWRIVSSTWAKTSDSLQ